MTVEHQLTFTTIGGEVVEVKTRGKHYVRPNGYAAPPGSGPARETCKSCQHYAHHITGSRKSFPKCGLTKWTSGRGSDILARSPACRRWEPPPPPKTGDRK